MKDGKIESLSRNLKNALMVILCHLDDCFVDDDGDQLSFEDGGNFSETGAHCRYGGYSFDFGDCVNCLEETSSPFRVEIEYGTDFRSLLDQFKTKESADKIISAILKGK